MAFAIIVDGQPWAASTVKEVTFLEAIDDSVFAKPVSRK